MPIQIDCPRCKGSGINPKWEHNDPELSCTNSECNNGKITVYTQEELDKAVQEEREANIEICMHTYGEEEPDVCVNILCAEAIIERGKDGD